MDCPPLPWMINFHSTQDGTILNQQYEAAFANDYIQHLCKINVDSALPKKRLSGIICSVGPKATPDLLENMMEAGMSIAVIKLAYCSMAEAKELIQNVRKAVMVYSMKLGRIYSLGIAIDIKGPEIRVGKVKDDNDELELLKGETTKLTNDPMYEEFVTKDMIYVNLKDFSTITPGDKILISDTTNGHISLSAQKIVGSVIKCLIENTGKFGSKASVSLEVMVNTVLINDEDKEAIEFCMQERVTFIFMPFVEQAEVIREARSLLGKESRNILMVAKIENSVGVYNIDSIIEESDGILISRVALASELAPEKVIVIQKMIIGKCNKQGVPSILAPSVLATMAANPTPTSAEIADITNAITDGVDCFWLSRETALGIYPIESIKALDSICRTAEPLMYHTQMFRDLTVTVTPVEPLYAISIAAVEAAMKCSAGAILVATVTGRSAKLIARFRPKCPVIAITRYAHVSRSLTMWRAIDAVHYIKKPEEKWCADIEKRIQFGITHGKTKGYIKTGDALVLVMGSKMGTGFTNALKIVYASEYDTFE
ncbi:PyK [Trypoxylus dichotomus]